MSGFLEPFEHPVGDAVEVVPPSVEPTEVDMRRLRAPRKIGVMLAVTWLIIVVLAAVFAGLLPLHSPQAVDPVHARAPSSFAHLFGTDDLGRDLLARSIYGARISMSVGALVMIISCVIGGGLGVVAGYFRGWVENVVMGAGDALIAFPALILAFALSAFLGANFENVVAIIAILAIPVVARVTRSQTLSLRTREFVLAAEALGAKTKRILLLEIAPNVLPTLVTYGLIVFAFSIVVEGVLGFLGIGIPPPTPTWGGMIAAGQPEIATSPHQSLIPAAVMFTTILALNVVAEWLGGWFERSGSR